MDIVIVLALCPFLIFIFWYGVLKLLGLVYLVTETILWYEDKRPVEKKVVDRFEKAGKVRKVW